MDESGATDELAQGPAGVRSGNGGDVTLHPNPPPQHPDALGPSGKVLLWLSLLIGTIVIGGASAMATWGVGLEVAGVLGTKWYQARSPTMYTFNSGFNIATVLGAAGLLVATGGAILGHNASPRWPTRVVFAWLGWYLFAGIGGVLLRRHQEIDLGMIEASGILLSVQTALIALPLYVLWQSQRVGRWLWRSAEQNSMLAGILIGASWALSGGLALALHLADSGPNPTADAATQGAVLRLAALAEDKPDLATVDLVRAWLSGEPTEPAVSRQIEGSTAGAPALPSADGLRATLAESRLTTCVESLAQPRESGLLAQAIRYLESERLGSGDAEDLAWETVVRICLRHADSPIADLRTYFFGALKNRKISFHRSPRSKWCSLNEAVLASYDTTLGLADVERDLEKAFCALSDTERTVVALRLSGADDGEIAQATHSSPGAVRQAASRGFRRLRAEMNRVD